MLSRKLSVLQDLADALPKEELEKRAALPFLRELKESVQGTVQEAVQKTRGVAGPSPLCCNVPVFLS